MKVGPKIVFELDPNPKNIPERPKNCKKGPKFGQIKSKRIDYISKTKVDRLHR